MTPITLRLKELRTARGWSQAELSRRSGIHKSTIFRLETGKRRGADFETLEKLAKALGCDPGYLIVTRKGRAK